MTTPTQTTTLRNPDRDPYPMYRPWWDDPAEHAAAVDAWLRRHGLRGPAAEPVPADPGEVDVSGVPF